MNEKNQSKNLIVIHHEGETEWEPLGSPVTSTNTLNFQPTSRKFQSKNFANTNTNAFTQNNQLNIDDLQQQIDGQLTVNLESYVKDPDLMAYQSNQKTDDSQYKSIDVLIPKDTGDQYFSGLSRPEDKILEKKKHKEDCQSKINKKSKDCKNQVLDFYTSHIPIDEEEQDQDMQQSQKNMNKKNLNQKKVPTIVIENNGCQSSHHGSSQHDQNSNDESISLDDDSVDLSELKDHVSENINLSKESPNQRHSFSSIQSDPQQEKLSLQRRKTIRKSGLVLMKGIAAKNRLNEGSMKSLRKFPNKSQDQRLNYKRKSTDDRSEMIDMLQTKQRRTSQRFQITSSEGQQMLQNHKLEKARQSVFILKALNQHKQMDQSESEDNEELNLQLYQSYMQEIDHSNQQTKKQNHKRHYHCLIIGYYSVNRLRFDFLTCILVLFDCFFVPLKNSFGLEFMGELIHHWILKIEYIFTFIFFLDLILGFRRAYINEKTGYEVICPNKIAIRYLKFYFWVDLLGCLPLDHYTDITFLRLLQLLKTVRLLRFQKLIHYMVFSSQARARIRIIQLILTLIICIHWVTCILYVVVTNNYQNELILTQDQNGMKIYQLPEFNFQYWIPQNQLNDGETDFYEDQKGVQLVKLYYYMILLLTGNDIVPQTSEQIFICTIFLFIGAIIIATIFGGISAEIQRAKDVEQQFQYLLDFVYFSLQIHDIDSNLQVSIISYICQKKEYTEIGEKMEDLLDLLNPEMKYKILEHIYYTDICEFNLFKLSEQNEIMYMVMLMKSKLSVSDEEIITQGDEAYQMFIIFQGTVKVYLNESIADHEYGTFMAVFKAKNRFSKILSDRKQRRKSSVIYSVKSDVQNKCITKFVGLFKRKNYDDIQKIKNQSKVSKIQEKLNDEDLQIIKSSSDLLPRKKFNSLRQLKQLCENAQPKRSFTVANDAEPKVSTLTDKQLGQIIDKQQDVLQQVNSIPKAAEKKELDIMRKQVIRKPIRKMTVGEVFGEIGILTKLKRTCSIISYQTCIFQTLSKENLQDIALKFPSLHNRIFDYMTKYNDEDLLQKTQFVHNIPYLRGLEFNTIKRIVYLIKQQQYEKGEAILMGYMENNKIMIVWEGHVQVRVERVDPDDNVIKSYWLDNLEKGACFSVFNCFENTNSIVNFYAASINCKIDVIDAKDLIDLGKEIIALNDRLNVIKLRIKNKHVDDIDYFTFPKKLLQNELEKQQYLDNTKNQQKYKESKQIMHQAILRNAKLIKLGLCKLPPVIDLLKLVREDIELIKKSELVLQQQAYNQLKEGLNIRTIQNRLKWMREKQQIEDLQDQIIECDSAYEVYTVSTIQSNLSSEDSIKCPSFHTEQSSVRNLKKQMTVTCDHQKSLLDENKTIEYSPEDCSSQCSSALESQIFRKKLRHEIEYDIKKYKKRRVQNKKALVIFDKQICHNSIIIDTFMKQIESKIFWYQHYHLLKHVVTKQKDETFLFRNQVNMARKNIQAIYSLCKYKDIQLIIDLVNQDDGLIQSKNLSKNKLQEELSYLNSINQNAIQNQNLQSRDNQSNTEQTSSVIDQGNLNSDIQMQSKIQMNRQNVTQSLQKQDIPEFRIEKEYQNKNQFKFDSNTLKYQKSLTQPKIDIDNNNQQTRSAAHSLSENSEDNFRKEQRRRLSLQRLQFLNYLKAKEKSLNDKDCNWIYSEKFMIQQELFENQLQLLNKQYYQLSQLQSQLDIQQQLIQCIQAQLEIDT